MNVKILNQKGINHIESEVARVGDKNMGVSLENVAEQVMYDLDNLLQQDSEINRIEVSCRYTKSGNAEEISLDDNMFDWISV